MTSFSFFKYFDAFELDVNVVNCVYYGKTRLHGFLFSPVYDNMCKKVISVSFP